MKKFITYIFIFFCTFSYSQDDDATADVIAAITAASLNEWAALNLMAEKQEKVYKSVKDIAYKSAVMVVLKRKYLKSLKKVNPILKKSLFYKEIIDIGKEIYDYQEESLKLAKDYADIYEKATLNKVKILSKVLPIMEDLRLAFIESDENLIDDIDRLDIMEMIKNDLVIIRYLSHQYYLNIRTLVLTSDTEPSKIDFSDLLKDLESDFDKIFPEDLNKE